MMVVEVRILAKDDGYEVEIVRGTLPVYRCGHAHGTRARARRCSSKLVRWWRKRGWIGPDDVIEGPELWTDDWDVVATSQSVRPLYAPFETDRRRH